MELRQLRDFVALAEELHYARAAARLGIEESPLSRRIKELEKDIGVLLFARTSRSTQLTPRGEFLLPRARAILDAADQLQQVVRSPVAFRVAVRIAVCDDVPARHLYSVLRQFQQSHPDIALCYVERTCEHHTDEARLELVDVGFGLCLGSSKGFIAHRLWTSNACAVFPRQHILSPALTVAATALRHMRIGLMVREASDPQMWPRLDELAHRLDDHSHLLSASSLKVLLNMVSSDSCIGIVGPAHAEMIPREDFSVIPIDHSRARFTTHMLYKDQPLKPDVKLVVDAVQAAWQKDWEKSSEMRDPER